MNQSDLKKKDKKRRNKNPKSAKDQHLSQYI